MITVNNFETILQYLSPAQIDQLRLYNFEVKKIIDRNRLRLPRKLVQDLDIEVKGEKFKISGQSVNRVEVTGDELMDHLKSLKVCSLSLDAQACPFLDKDWLQGIEEIYCIRFKSEEAVYSFSEKLNCSELAFFNFFQINGTKILNNLPFVTSIQMYFGNFNKKFFETLVEKSKIGPGLKRVQLRYGYETPFTVDDIIYFLKNAKFQNLEDRINWVGLTIPEKEAPENLSEISLELNKLVKDNQTRVGVWASSRRIPDRETHSTE